MKRALLMALMAVSLVAVGCSDEEPGTPTPPLDTPSAGAPSGGGGEVDAPKVANPVADVDKFTQAPCDMVTKEQAAELGFDAKIEPEADTSQGPACDWRNEANDDFSIVLLKDQPLGISGIYRNHQELPELDAYFEPIDVAGFPGVFGDSTDRRPNGMCTLTVGVTDQQVIVVTNYVKNTDPCEVVKKAAEAAVTTMSKG